MTCKGGEHGPATFLNQAQLFARIVRLRFSFFLSFPSRCSRYRAPYLGWSRKTSSTMMRWNSAFRLPPPFAVDTLAPGSGYRPRRTSLLSVIAAMMAQLSSKNFGFLHLRVGEVASESVSLVPPKSRVYHLLDIWQAIRCHAIFVILVFIV